MMNHVLLAYLILGLSLPYLRDTGRLYQCVGDVCIVIGIFWCMYEISLIKVADLDGDGEVSKDEFYRYMLGEAGYSRYKREGFIK